MCQLTYAHQPYGVPISRKLAAHPTSPPAQCLQAPQHAGKRALHAASQPGQRRLMEGRCLGHREPHNLSSGGALSASTHQSGHRRRVSLTLSFANTSGGLGAGPGSAPEDTRWTWTCHPYSGAVANDAEAPPLPSPGCSEESCG